MQSRSNNACQNTRQCYIGLRFDQKNSLNVQDHVASSAENKENAISCGEKSILKLWKKVNFKKHEEFSHLKSIEKGTRNSKKKPQIVQS